MAGDGGQKVSHTTRRNWSYPPFFIGKKPRLGQFGQTMAMLGLTVTGILGISTD